MKIIEVKNLSKQYDDQTVVDQISFAVKKGEIFGILGPNGAGKTTTLEMIETLTPLSSGEIKLDGLDAVKNSAKIKQIIGVQLQSSRFFDHLNLKEHLKLFADIYKTKINPQELLEKVDLGNFAKHYPEKLSGGQKQRFSIALALVNQPKVLFLDEPTTGLDPQARINLWDLIKKINQTGITIILTTHYMDEAELLCDRLAIMDQGQILTIDTPANLIDKLLKSGFKKEVEVKQANLEDVFLELTGKELRQ